MRQFQVVVAGAVQSTMNLRFGLAARGAALRHERAVQLAPKACVKRVIVVGPGASGKSTLATRLGQITGLPVIELDKLF